MRSSSYLSAAAVEDWSRINFPSLDCAVRIACQTLSGVAGMPRWVMPRGLSASTS
jgi:hypothetical protein